MNFGRIGNYLESVDVNHFIGYAELLHGFHLKKYAGENGEFMLKCCAVGYSMLGEYQ